MKATQACNAECPYFLEPDHLQPLADHCDLDYSARGGGKTSKAYTGRKDDGTYYFYAQRTFHP